MADVFISYKKEDRAMARGVADALEHSGYTSWWDDALSPRESWDQTIEREARDASVILVIWTPRSVASDWVRTEAAFGKDHKKLVPLMLEACDVPFAFRLTQSAMLTDWEGGERHPEWQKALGWIRRLAGEGSRYSGKSTPLQDSLSAGAADARAFRVILEAPLDQAHVGAVAWSPDGQYFVTGGYDKTAKIRRRSDGKILQVLQGHAKEVQSVAWSSDGNLIATGSGDHSAKVWRARDGECINTFYPGGKTVGAVAFNPAVSTELATANGNKSASVWDTSTSEKIANVTGVDSRADACSWSADGSQLFVVSWSDDLRVWNRKTRMESKLGSGVVARKFVAPSPDGRTIATASGWLYEIRLVRADDGTDVRLIKGYKAEPIAGAWSPDSAMLLTCAGIGSDRGLRLWRASDGALLRHFDELREEFHSVAWNPRTGDIVAVGGGKAFVMALN